jgi:hypothetical protein
MRARAWRRPAVLTETRVAQDSECGEFTAKVIPGHPLYRERVAIPVMEAVDAMPPAWRELVHEFGYVDVYRAWRSGRWTPAEVRSSAFAGHFTLG